MIENYKTYTDIITSVMESKGMKLVGTDSIGYDNYHYFAFENNPLELNVDFNIEFEADEPNPHKITCWFETTTGNPAITDIVHDNKEYSMEFTVFEKSTNQEMIPLNDFKREIEKGFVYIEPRSKDIVAPMLCKEVLTFNDSETFKKVYRDLIDTPIKLLTLFEYADMVEEYNEWVLRIMVDELLPASVKDIFIF